ncbi:MAG TPA: trehalose-phosphatase [Caulobacteraceae bacterium]|jgi:trehalose 6-phosphate phosphatase
MPLPPPPALALDEVALFLDLDGTLAPIAPTPEQVSGDDELWAILDALHQQSGGRLAVLSGRTIADIDRITAGHARAVAGVHGLERRGPGGDLARPDPPEGLYAARGVMEAFAARRPGVLVEDKGLGIALHYRQAPEHAEDAEQMAQALAQHHDLRVQPGSMVRELRAPGGGKGQALKAFMEEPPFAGATPVFLGDDLTDEDGFAAVRAMGGHGVIVGPREPTRARFRLRDVAAARAWLARLAGLEAAA